ncbi:MAG TPA: hypothetical protein VD886_22100, partial [Herpetosiphonaceae bacterium]|nr:hypothetical protein [Herpetosiphonaceae bacterium]
MSEPIEHLLALLAFPGLLATIVLTLLVVLVGQLPAPGGGLTRGIARTLAGDGSPLLLAAALAPAAAAALLPWPGSPLDGWRLDRLWLVWAILELSHALALLPGLQSPSPSSMRAAMREAQMGAAGRVAFWVAIGITVWAGPWTWPSLPAHILALLAAALALPAAAAWGPFAPERSIAPGGPEGDMGRAAADLAQWGRAVRTTVIASLVPVLALPPIPDAHWGINLALAVVITLILATIGRVMNGNSVRRPTLDGLRWCYTRALPLALLAGVAVVLGNRW